MCFIVFLWRRGITGFQAGPITPNVRNGHAEVEEGLPSQDSLASAVVENGHGGIEPVSQELEKICLNRLMLRHIRVLREALDAKDWYVLGMNIFTGKQHEKIQIRIRNLKLAHAGGGSPATAFFDVLAAEHPKHTVGHILKKVRSLRRDDVLLLLEGIDEDMLFRHIDFMVRIDLAARLELEEKGGVRCWRDLAGELGYNPGRIAQIALTVKEENANYPTEELIKLINMRLPYYTIGELRIELLRIGQIKVADYLAGISIDNLAPIELMRR